MLCVALIRKPTITALPPKSGFLRGEKQSSWCELMFGQSEAASSSGRQGLPLPGLSNCENKRRRRPTKVCFHGDFISFAEALPSQVSLCWSLHSEVTRYRAPDTGALGDLRPLFVSPGPQLPATPLKRPSDPLWREWIVGADRSFGGAEPSTSRSAGERTW